ncbi:hypothetical protein GTA08_BOTSDO02814 [Neofusicoccum parvum]|nr:hypothetical protein GTA08_BOTSDO02814 [Neofusicoccum parvum]
MRLREMERKDYKVTRTNHQRTPETTSRPSATPKTRARKTGHKAANPAVAGQRCTVTGRVTKTAAAATTKRSPGRPLKRGPGRPPKRGPGRPPRNGSGRASTNTSSSPAKNGSSLAPKSAATRRASKREYKPASPIVKIVKKAPVQSDSSSQDDCSNPEHHTSLMHRFFRAHGDEVAHIPKKKQRKALGKLWRESPLNPKNARAEKESRAINAASDADDEDEEVGEAKQAVAGGDETDPDAVEDELSMEDELLM